jgi:hypothetical protein
MIHHSFLHLRQGAIGAHQTRAVAAVISILLVQAAAHVKASKPERKQDHADQNGDPMVFYRVGASNMLGNSDKYSAKDRNSANDRGNTHEAKDNVLHGMRYSESGKGDAAITS